MYQNTACEGRTLPLRSWAAPACERTHKPTRHHLFCAYDVLYQVAPSEATAADVDIRAAPHGSNPITGLAAGSDHLLDMHSGAMELEPCSNRSATSHGTSRKSGSGSLGDSARIGPVVLGFRPHAFPAHVLAKSGLWRSDLGVLARALLARDRQN